MTGGDVVNRRTWDVGLPLLYALAIVAVAIVGWGQRAMAGVAVIGAMLLGLYWSVLRRNLTS